ncbi:MAG: hypothetical protein HY700_21265 [Gemmatimonadetes bacterium]|nr:hypothetical protein [Gemmatimonadota bacterium]
MSTVASVDPSPGIAVPPVGPPDGLTFADLFTAIRRRARPVAIWCLACTVVAVVVALLIPNTYTAHIGLVPETRAPTGSGQIAGLAALAGVSLSGMGSSQSPQFYAALLEGRPISQVLLRRKFSRASAFPGTSGADSLSLTEILYRRNVAPGKKLERAARVLRRMTRVSVDLRSGIVQLAVRHRSPQLAADLGNAYIEELLKFNNATRQTQARAKRQFVEARAAEAQQQVRKAEDDVRGFLERNRVYQNSPALQFELTRLQRVLTMQQELYLDLQRQLDAARIAEVDDLPTVSVVEQAVVPQEKSGPPRTIMVLASVLLAAIVGMIWAVFAEYRDLLFGGASSGGWSRSVAPPGRPRQDGF